MVKNFLNEGFEPELIMRLTSLSKEEFAGIAADFYPPKIE